MYIFLRWERLTTRLFLPRPESASQLHSATLLSSPHLSPRYLDTKRDALCWVTQDVDMRLTQLLLVRECVCVQLSNPANWRHSRCWGLDPHPHVHGPTLGRPLHQDAASVSMWQASNPRDSWETQTMGMGNINELSKAGLRKGGWLEKGTGNFLGG